MHNFILATGNAHKAQEFGVLFDKNIITVEAAAEKLEVVEDGKSFNENALKKAKAYFDKYQKPVMADDSGLCVEAIPNELGIHTARYGGEGLSAKERSELLVKNMNGVQNRACYFVCVLCFYLNENEVFFFEGRVHGEVADKYQGEHGFGYDPVFKPLGEHGGKTLAELPQWKDLNSHRAKACKEAQTFFSEAQ